MIRFKITSLLICSLQGTDNKLTNLNLLIIVIEDINLQHMLVDISKVLKILNINMR